VEDLVHVEITSVRARPTLSVSKGAAAAVIFPQEMFQQSFRVFLSKLGHKAGVPLSKERMAQCWFQLNLAPAELDLVEATVTRVEVVHASKVTAVAKVEAMALMERSDEGTEGPGVVWI